MTALIRTSLLTVALPFAAAAAFPFAAAAAEPTNPPAMSAPDAWVAAHAGTVRVLNKLDSTVQTVTLQVGESVTIQTLKLSLLGCTVRPPDLPPDAAAHLAITDSHPGNAPYNSWILKNEPAINMLENPIYDVQLAGCA